jgi:predicted RND superfamily exporter protein
MGYLMRLTGMFEVLSARYARWIIDQRWLVLAGCLIFVALAGAGLSRITLTADYRVFFSEEDPRFQAFEAFESTYTKMDTILLVVKPANGDVFAPETLAVVYALTEEAWQIPHSVRVDSLANFQHPRADGDDIVVAALIEDPGDVSAPEVRTVALAEPSLKNRLVAADGRATGVVVTLQLPGADHTVHVPESVQAARAMAEKFEAKYPGLQVALTGMVLMSFAQMEVIEQDMRTLVPFMYGAIVVLLLVLLRSVMGTIACLLVITFSVLPSTGIMGWAGLQVDQASASAPVIIMTLAIADCVHILLFTFQEMSAGRNKHEALAQSLSSNAQPIFLTSLTTAIGFLSLNFSDTLPFQNLGNFTAVGVTVAWLMSMTFLPALMAVVPLRPKRLALEIKAMQALGDFVVVNRRRLAWGFGLFALPVIALIPTLDVEDRYVEWFDESTVFRQDTDFATENLVGPYVLEFSVPSGESGGVLDNVYLERLEAFTTWLRTQEEVVHVGAITDVMKRLNRSMHGDDSAWYRLPEDRRLAAQYLLLYEMSLPYGLDLNSQINIDKSASRITVTLQNTSSTQLRAFAARAEKWMTNNTPPAMHTTATGIALAFAHIGQRNIESMLSGTALAFLLISMIITVALRSIRLGLISLVSNTFPVLITFGMWAILAGEVGIIASVIAATTLGLVVDDTVHFLSKYHRAKHEQGMTTHDAIRSGFDHVGNALWVTTVILVTGFSVLAFSVFDLNVQLGVLTAMTLASALALDFLLLPALLMWIDRQEICTCQTCLADHGPRGGRLSTA